MNYNKRRKRDEIIGSQKLFWNFLDSNIINKLIHLFDDTESSPNKISKYVENERRIRGLDDATIKGEVYREEKLTYNLLLEICKNNKPILHISFHTAPDSFRGNKSGPIHLYKNMYRENKRTTKKNRYSLIRVGTPIGKPHSLEFSIPDGYKTPGVNTNEKQLEEEMDVIMHVINRIFDENDTYYIGDKNKLVHIHNLSNTIQTNINKSPNVTRKNKGVTMYPPFTNNKPYHQNITRKTYKISKRTTPIKLTPLYSQHLSSVDNDYSR